MKLAFLDTSVINWCHKSVMTGYELAELFSKQNLIPVLGIYTTYELAKDFLNTDEPSRAINLFCIILYYKGLRA